MKIRRVIFGTIMTAVSAVPAFSQMKSLTFRDALSLRTPESVTISDDGRHVAFTLREIDWNESRFRSHIWVVNTENLERIQYTHGDTSESSLQFSPDGKMLAFTSSRTDTESDPETRSQSQIWLIPIGGGEATKLTSAQNGISSYRWSADGKEIFFTTRETLDQGALERRARRRRLRFDQREHEKIIYKREIWKADVASGKTERVFEGMLDLASVAPAPDGRRFAFTTNRTGQAKDGPLTNVWIYDAGTGKARQLTSRHGEERNPIWSPDGNSILFTAGEDPQTSYSQSDYFIVRSTGGEPVNLTADFDRSPANPLFSADGKGLITAVADGFYTHLYRLDIGSRALQPILKETAHIGDLDLAEESEKLVYTKQTGSTLPEIYVSNMDGTNPKKITDFNSQLKGFAIADQEVITWNSKDGLQIEGLLVYPLDHATGTSVPLIVSPHGGPHGRVTDTFNGEYQVWAANGYAVLSPNFRGSSGYGADFDVANKKDIGFGDYEDVMTGVDKVVEMGVADPDRMGVQGGSYGGFMTNWIITHTDRFRAAVSKYGLWNLITDWSNSNNPRWELNYLEAYYWDDMDLWLKHSPGTYVQNVKTPVLILHGEDDPNTVLANSREMYQALLHAGKTVELVIYPREAHGISREPNHILDRQRRVVDWFAKYILREAEGSPVGSPVTDGRWEMTVLRATAGLPSRDEKGIETKTVTVELELRHLGEGEEAFALDLVHDVFLRSEQDREFSAIGLLGLLDGSEELVKTDSLECTGRSVYVMRLVFQVPAWISKSRFEMKEFPCVALVF